MDTLSGRRRLRFAILCDDVVAEKWQLLAIEALERSNAAECVAIAVPAQPSARPIRRSRPNRHSLYNLFFRVVSPKLTATKKASITQDRPNVPVMRVETERRRDGRVAVRQSSLAELASLELDFAVRFGFGILSGEILQTPRFGVWSYHHGDPARFRGQPPGVWEIYHRSPVTGAIVQRLNEALDGGEVLAQASFATQDGSYARQLNALLLGSTSLLADAALRFSRRDGALEAPSHGLGPIYRKPTNSQMLKLAWVIASNRIGALLRSLFRHQQWALVVVADCTVEAILKNGMNVPLDRYLANATTVPEEKGKFAADPFLLSRRASRREGFEIVFERFDWRSGKGHIASVRADLTGRVSRPVRLLELNTHLSYPFVSARDGLPTILPESCEGGRLVEYALDSSGTEARAVHDHGAAVTDPTILFHNGRHWMFYCRDAKNSELCIRYAEDPDGPWAEHVLNPVKIDVRNARPAGAILKCGGELYRPAQICAPHYGWGIVFNRILALDEATFSEEPVASIVPSQRGKYRHGVHTIAEGEGFLVFDHARMTFSPRETMRVLSTKIMKSFI